MKKLSLIIASLLCVGLLSAQDNGYLTGSFETSDHAYVADPTNRFTPNGDTFGSNNYLKLDYYKGKFSAGLQTEAYVPALIGYPAELNKFAFSNLYASWKDEDFQITAGTFYDQFGSGLLFRSWEDRLLGLNNAIMGARFAYNYEDKVAFKALWGMPRLGMEFSDTRLRGADLSVSLSNIIGWDSVVFSVEGSVLSKYSQISLAAEEAGGKPTSTGWSGRVNFDYDGFFVKGEYVDLGEKLVALQKKHGNAQLVEFGYNGRGLGVTMTGRRLEWMGQNITSTSISSANLISYVPAMSTQYTYMLTTLHPYNPQVGDESTFMFNSGEIGGQIDAFYNFRRGTKIGGKRGMKVHANFSTYYSLNAEGGTNGAELLFRDFSVDVERQWTKKFKTTLMYSMQDYNKDEKNYEKYPVYVGLSHIVVADLLYKWTPKFATRLELQYLSSKDYQKDWMAALLEVTFAPHWSVFASDMYNHGDSKLHYYNAGVGFTYSKIRLAAGYGRYRAGFICSGGVCREIPAYTGANLSLTASF